MEKAKSGRSAEGVQLAETASSPSSHLEKPLGQSPFGVCSQVDDKVEKMLEDALHSWEFDALALADLTDNKPLSTLAVHLFEQLGLIEQFELDVEKITGF